MLLKFSNKAYKEFSSKKFTHLKKEFNKAMSGENVKVKKLYNNNRRPKLREVALYETRIVNRKLRLDYRIVFSKDKGETYIVDIFKKQRQTESDRISNDYQELSLMKKYGAYKEEILS